MNLFKFHFLLFHNFIQEYNVFGLNLLFIPGPPVSTLTVYLFFSLIIMYYFLKLPCLLSTASMYMDVGPCTRTSTAYQAGS